MPPVSGTLVDSERPRSKDPLLFANLPDGFTPLPLDETGARGYRFGPRRPGLPLLLLPGIEGDARVFANQTQLARDRSVVAFDLPNGCASLRAMGEAVLVRLDQIWESVAPRPGMKPRVAVAGLSLGGLVGRAMAALAPEQVAALITLGTLPAPALVPPNIRRGRMRAGTLPAPIFDLIYGARIKHRLTEEGVDPLITSQLVSELPDKAEIVRRLDAVLGWGLPEDPGVPSLWLLGQVDAESPWTPADILRFVPGASVEVVPGGHRAPLTHPLAFHDALERFLDRRV